MNSIHVLVARDDSDEGLNTTTLSLVVSIVVLILLGVALVAALLFLRKMRRARRDAAVAQQLPLYEKRQSGHRRMTITASPYSKGGESVIVYQEKQDLMANSSSPPASPVPEIRITFPDEVDEAGKPQSGRVVVVRVGEHSVGLEPLNDQLPPYDRFDSLDLDRIGGLKEKNAKDQYS